MSHLTNMSRKVGGFYNNLGFIVVMYLCLHIPLFNPFKTNAVYLSFFLTYAKIQSDTTVDERSYHV